MEIESADKILMSADINTIDVLIIGAGPVGLAAGLWFAKKGYKVVLIEQYAEVVCDDQRAYNERSQQVGINPKSLRFIRNLDVIIWGNIKTQGCMQDDWINIPICALQNIFYKELRMYNNVKILYKTVIESVNCFNKKHNARVVVIQDNSHIYAFFPELIIVADGRHDEKGSARQFFNFQPASKVKFSTYGIIGIIKREKEPNQNSICLASHSSNSYMSELYQELGVMHIRLLGSMEERYVALGVANPNNLEAFKNLTTTQIHDLLKEAYDKLRDTVTCEPEFSKFTEYSKNPIPIVLDYRKETIKVLDGSTTIVTVEGDAARKTTFFSGSGLNSGYEGLMELFKLCEENKDLIFSTTNDANHLLNLDQKLLEKDAACMKISLRLLIKGSSFITGNKTPEIKPAGLLTKGSRPASVGEPKIHQIVPTKGEASSHIYIKGDNLLGNNCKPPTISFTEKNGVTTLVYDVIVYNNNTLGVKVPKNIYGDVTVTINRMDKKTIVSPIKFTVIKVTDLPEIVAIKKKNGYLRIDGENFVKPLHITMEDHIGKQKIKGYCSSINSVIFSPPYELTQLVRFTVTTCNGDSDIYEHQFNSY